MSQDERENDELPLGDGRLDLEEEEVAATGEGDEADGIPLDEAFNGDYQDVLLDADDAVTPPLSELINACWYSSAVIVARQPVIGNQPLFDEWVRDHIGEDFDVVTVSADLLMTPDELLEDVLEELGLEAGEDEGPGECLLAALNRQEGSAQQHPRELVIQVENAHELGERAQHSLIELVAGHETMITPHIILWWGDPSQDSLAEGEAVSVIRLDIPPFSRQAVVEYLTYCWGQHTAGTLPLDEEQIDTIITASGGAADAMDRLALAELRTEQVPVRERLGRLLPRGLPRRHGMVAGVLALVLIFSFFLRDGGADDAAEENTSVVRVERSLPDPSADSPAAGSVDAGTQAVAPSGAGGDTAARQPADTADEAAAAERAPGTEQAEATGQPAPEPGEAEEAAGEAAGETGTALPESEPPPAEAEREQMAADNGGEASAGTPEADTPRTALEQVADERFFIQLLGSHSVETATDFMTEHEALNGEERALHRFEARYQGRPWHVVIHGPYQDRAAAETALEGLPRALRSASPWVRSMADIRSAMSR